jgi:hypothetical protein
MDEPLGGGLLHFCAALFGPRTSRVAAHCTVRLNGAL